MLAIKPKTNGRARRAENRIWTYAEMETELPETNLPTELWDGELTMAPAPSFYHQDITLRFYKMLDAWVSRHRLGKVVASPMDMVLSPHRSVQPDVLFISNARLGIIQRVVRGPADLVAEVISPSTRRKDRIDKRDLYEQHGVQEYWIIDPEPETVEVLYLEKEQFKLAGRWRTGETARSKRGFTVAVDDLFEK